MILFVKFEGGPFEYYVGCIGDFYKLLFLLLHFNPFVPNAPFLYPLKISENRKVFRTFSGGRERVHWERMS